MSHSALSRPAAPDRDCTLASMPNESGADARRALLRALVTPEMYDTDGPVEMCEKYSMPKRASMCR